MLIPEAVNLVLQAASLGEQKATYVLDMGEQIQVLDLARNVIRLSGFVPEQDIAIQFIGLRPGEKLHEELIGLHERAGQSVIDKIIKIHRTTPLDLAGFQQKEMVLEAAAHLDNSSWALQQLQEIVPSFRSASKPREIVNALPAKSNNVESLIDVTSRIAKSRGVTVDR